MIARKFIVGTTYRVYGLSDDPIADVQVIGRKGHAISLADGRTVTAFVGCGSDESYHEVLRLDEVGPVATGGIVRADSPRTNA